MGPKPRFLSRSCKCCHQPKCSMKCHSKPCTASNLCSPWSFLLQASLSAKQCNQVQSPLPYLFCSCGHVSMISNVSCSLHSQFCALVIAQLDFLKHAPTDLLGCRTCAQELGGLSTMGSRRKGQQRQFPRAGGLGFLMSSWQALMCMPSTPAAD